MYKYITFPTFAFAFIGTALIFVTSTSYWQLGTAMLIYAVLSYLVLKVFPRGSKSTHVEISYTDKAHQTEVLEKETEDVIDVNKRAFLKLIGAAGLSFFIFSIFSRKAQIPFLAKMQDSEPTTLPAPKNPMDGYQVAEIDDSDVSYYGFTNKDGNWIIMREDTEASSFRYVKGAEAFPDNWSNRVKLNYEYFHNVF